MKTLHYDSPSSIFLPRTAIMSDMNILIGYPSALLYWRVAGPRFLRGYEPRRAATARARTTLETENKPALVGGNRRPGGCTLPVHVIVGNATVRTETSSIISHTWASLPDQGVIDVGEGFLMSTPEFCFLQAASKLSLVQLILLGFELCGTYVVVEGEPARRREAPLTSVAKLRAFIESAVGARGRAKAARALRYILDKSASPMETVLAMLLCLPNKLGGYGIPAAQMNYHVDVPSRMRKLADRSYCECDLCWPEVHLCLEYDSELHHADLDRRQSDARRRNTLLALGYTVVTVSYDQVANNASFNRLAHQTAQRVGKRLRLRDPEFTRAHLALRSELWESLAL